jgi:hypothetical protein
MEQEEISVEKKLGDLMMRGWTLLADSCPSECKYYLT